MAWYSEVDQNGSGEVDDEESSSETGPKEDGESFGAGGVRPPWLQAASLTGTHDEAAPLPTHRWTTPTGNSAEPSTSALPTSPRPSSTSVSDRSISGTFGSGTAGAHSNSSHAAGCEPCHEACPAGSSSSQHAQ